MREIAVAITGFGTIGRQVARLIHAREERYRTRFDTRVRVTGVCASQAGLCDPAGLAPARLAERAAFVPGLTGAAFLERVHADVLFEASPTDFRTGGAALAYMDAALCRRMPVIAISKGALALAYPRLRAEARRHGVALKVSGATASALPTIDLLQYNLAGCEVASVEAILTGTTNLILSEMMDSGCTFDAALREAQRLGIAEADPSLDIDGWDTACKLAILANAAFEADIDVQALPRTGIGHVDAQAIQAWRVQGRVPRLVGRIERNGAQLRAEVGLRLYDAQHPFARVHGRTKAIHVRTDLMGEFTVIGGASDPVATAAAALKDFEHVLAGS